MGELGRTMGGFGQRDMVAAAASGRGGCLELEFRDLEGLDGLDTRFNTPWRLPAAGAGGYPVRCARQAATVPELAAGT